MPAGLTGILDARTIVPIGSDSLSSFEEGLVGHGFTIESGHALQAPPFPVRGTKGIRGMKIRPSLFIDAGFISGTRTCFHRLQGIGRGQGTHRPPIGGADCGSSFPSPGGFRTLSGFPLQ